MGDIITRAPGPETPLARDGRACHPGVVADDSPADRALAVGLVQPDGTTCGSCALVVARMLTDPAYAGALVTGTDPATGAREAGTVRDRFHRRALAMHRVTSGLRDSGGGLQLPWPSALGTSPWAVAREMTHQANGSRRYRARLLLPRARHHAFGALATHAQEGYAVPLFVGNRVSPRHVVLVLPHPLDQAGPATDGTPSEEVRIYDPASGRRYPIDAGDFAGGTLGVAGWRVPWFVVVPT